MLRAKRVWDVLILDAWPPVTEMGGLAAGDVDGDGHVEVIISGRGQLRWYRPVTLEQGVIAEGAFVVGITVGDVDGDGIGEVVASSASENKVGCLRWFKPRGNASGRWEGHDIDTACAGPAHDLMFADVDGDGRPELLANATGARAGLFLYKRADGQEGHWRKHTVFQSGIFEEGLAAGDLNGDGRLEIVHGPDVYFQPDGGPFGGPWQRTSYAANFREMVRVAAVDITGSGRCDIVVAESEYLDGRMSWFENRLVENPAAPWIEHPIDERLYYAHSMHARRNVKSGEVRVFVAEMAEGGWRAPRNRDARLMDYYTRNAGKTWRREMIYQGCGTHQAFLMDVDGDGVAEVVGKQWRPPKVHLFKRRRRPSRLNCFEHKFIDRDKPTACTDIVAADIDGDGLADVACGQYWYKNPTWQRFEVTGFELINAFDIDGDGRAELIATRRRRGVEKWSQGLTSELYWLRAVDPQAGRWQEHFIGTGTGDWPHGTAIGPLGPGGRLVLLVGYHSAGKKGDPPEMFVAPDDPAGQWQKRVLADIPYGEEMLIRDVDQDGRLDVIAGPWWLENLGDGMFRPHQMVEGFRVARVGAADLNGDGRLDVILGEEVLGGDREVPRGRLAWLEHPEDPRGPWPVRVIDSLRCPHSVGVADLDGDGRVEVVAGEHDPHWPYRSRCRLMVYKQADRHARAWWRYVLDERFEHHDGCRIIELSRGRVGILSHGWKDARYVSLWQPATRRRGT